jgi:hypothetical protein
MLLGYCLDCSASYESPYVTDGLCPICKAREEAIFRNDPRPYVETDTRQYTKAAMRERLGVTEDEDQ